MSTAGDEKDKDKEKEKKYQEEEKEKEQEEQEEKEQEQKISSASTLFPRHVPDRRLLEPYRYIHSVPGKNVRGRLIDCFQLWLGVDSPDTLRAIHEIVADLHNASLLIDDIEDGSKLRRGVPVAHLIFGVAPVINCANYVYFLALEKCHALGNTQAMHIFVTELLNLHKGQGLDIEWRDSARCPTEAEYCEMVKNKTGGLFRLAVGLLQSFGTRSRHVDFTPLVNNLGLYFQIRDDLINLVDEDYFKSKSFCEDLTEGKFSFPLIYGIYHSPWGRQLLSILQQRTTDVDVKRYAQSLLRQAGCLAYTRRRCTSIKGEILAQIGALGGNEPLGQLIEMLDVQLQGLNVGAEPEAVPPHVATSTTTTTTTTTDKDDPTKLGGEDEEEEEEEEEEDEEEDCQKKKKPAWKRLDTT